ncbi:MAG: chemotaxis protein CheB [Sporichthyaceae bacterium]
MTPPATRVVAVGASAGGVEALREFVAHLPPDLPAAVCVVLHVPEHASSALPAILDRAGALPAVGVAKPQPLRDGEVLVAAPGRHLLVWDGQVRLGHGPRENGHRPAVDVLFRSAARWWGPRAVGVVLSGSLDDGAAGLATLVRRGGTALVQDPDTAAHPGMPAAALGAVPDAARARPAELAGLLDALCREPCAAPTPQVDEQLAVETALAELDEAASAAARRPGRPAGLACPECHGAMFELEEGSLVRYRCRVGHAWSPQSLLVEQVEATESALWMAVRVMEEKAALHRRLAARDGETARRMHQRRAEDTDHGAEIIRDLLRRSEASPPPIAG